MLFCHALGIVFAVAGFILLALLYVKIDMVSIQKASHKEAFYESVRGKTVNSAARVARLYDAISEERRRRIRNETDLLREEKFFFPGNHVVVEIDEYS